MSRWRAMFAFLIIFAGIAGGLIGYAYVDLQCKGSCVVGKTAGTLTGVVMVGIGVGVVATLILRSFRETPRDRPSS